MKLADAQAIAKCLIVTHGLFDQGWRFAFDNARSRFGLTNYEAKTISLSKHLTRLNDEARIRNTILHEIAHALSPRGTGHGPAWVNMARAIGCDGQRCVKETQAVIVRRPWQASCAKCGTLQIFRFKRGEHQLHSTCRGAITWIANKEGL